MKWMSVIHPFSWWLPSRVFQETLQHDSLRVGWWILIRVERLKETPSHARLTDRKKKQQCESQRNWWNHVIANPIFFEDLQGRGSIDPPQSFCCVKIFFHTPGVGIIHLNPVYTWIRSWVLLDLPEVKSLLEKNRGEERGGKISGGTASINPGNAPFQHLFFLGLLVGNFCDHEISLGLCLLKFDLVYIFD